MSAVTIVNAIYGLGSMVFLASVNIDAVKI